MNARRWLDFLLPGASTLQFDWIRDLVQGDRNLFARVSRSPAAQRLLTREAYKLHQIVVPDRTRLEPQHQWLLSSHEQQIELARQLGIKAVREFIRTTIEARIVTAIRKQLGNDGYQRALASAGLNVVGLDRSQFIQAAEQGKLAEHIVGIGAALLELTAPKDPFCHMRMRFSFAPVCWHSRPRNIRVDATELAAQITRVPGA